MINQDFLGLRHFGVWNIKLLFWGMARQACTPHMITIHKFAGAYADASLQKWSPRFIFWGVARQAPTVMDAKFRIQPQYINEHRMEGYVYD